MLLDNTFNNDIDDDNDDDEEAASSAEAEKAAKIEKLPDHLHQAAGHALLLRARTGTGTSDTELYTVPLEYWGREKYHSNHNQ